jgi:hypothetical protein
MNKFDEFCKKYDDFIAPVCLVLIALLLALAAWI